MTITMNQLLLNVTARSFWALLNFGSAFVSAFSASIQTVVHVLYLKPTLAGTCAVAGCVGFCADLGTAAGLLIGTVKPPAPEAIGITEKDWNYLSNATKAVAALDAWSKHKWPASGSNYTRTDVAIFQAAARVLTVAAALSYANHVDAIKIVEPQWKCHLIDEKNAQCMVLCAHGTAILAFRGTELPDDDETMREAIPDWWRNVRFSLVAYPFSKKNNDTADDDTAQVAEGFAGGYSAVRATVLKILKDHSVATKQEMRLYVCGHSQGGALAACSLLDLFQQQELTDTYSVKGCIAVAQPKMCNASYANQVQDYAAEKGIPLETLGNQDVTGFDPVVSVPPQAFAKGTVAPPGRFWKVRVGETTTGPETLERHEEIVHGNVLFRVLTSAPLHWPGGRVGYLSALEE